MIFKQKDDGSCDILFSEEEIKVVNKYKKLYLTPEFLRHFSNTLVKMSIEFNKKFDKKTKNLLTYEKTKIIGTEPKK